MSSYRRVQEGRISWILDAGCLIQIQTPGTRNQEQDTLCCELAAVLISEGE